MDFEEAAGKWRAGDPVKSMRFFQRAIDVYQEGLDRFPQSADLAYNKARVQYEVATHPILQRQSDVPLLDALNSALASHRYALALDNENADTLFNTSQVLTSVAEEMVKDDQFNMVILELLEEALELQNRCLSLQELKYAQDREQESEAARMAERGATTEGSSVVDDGQSETSPSFAQQDDRWFAVLEPVTMGTLIDTVLAQLATLATLCEALMFNPESASVTNLPWVEEYSTWLLCDKLPLYTIDSTERSEEIALAKATFISTLLEAGFRTRKLDAKTYETRRDSAFASKELKLETSLPALIANAESMMSFSSAIKHSATGEPSKAWNALAGAMTNLSAASKLPNIRQDDLAKTHLLRADCSLLQARLAEPPSTFSLATSNRTQLLKNADVFYRNAMKLSCDEEEKQVAGFRAVIAAKLTTGVDPETLDELVVKEVQQPLEWLMQQLFDMIDEDLLSEDYRT